MFDKANLLHKMPNNFVNLKLRPTVMQHESGCAYSGRLFVFVESDPCEHAVAAYFMSN